MAILLSTTSFDSLLRSTSLVQSTFEGPQFRTNMMVRGISKIPVWQLRSFNRAVANRESSTQKKAKKRKINKSVTSEKKNREVYAVFNNSCPICRDLIRNDKDVTSTDSCLQYNALLNWIGAPIVQHKYHL